MQTNILVNSDGVKSTVQLKVLMPVLSDVLFS